MKNFTRISILIFVIQLVTISNHLLFGQKLKPADVPADVTQTLEFQYPYVKVTSWVKEDGSYIATIKDEGSTGKVYISSEGKWMRTTFAVPQSELPSAIVEYVKKNYPDFAISESCLEEKESEKTHYYLEVKLDGFGTKPSMLTFSASGKNELLTRNDPADFKDPLAPVEKPEPVKPAAKDPKSTTAKPATTTTKPATTTSKPATTKPATTQSSSAAKPATTKQETNTTKPATTKQETNTTKPTTAAKPTADKKEAEPAKSEKPKKEKPEPIVKDENGNIALKANTVPAIVTKSLAKKVMHPEELNWFLVDSTYIARCLNVGKKTAVYIKPNGEWDKTLTVLPEESVTGPMLKHLNDYYSGFRFKSAVKEQRADKNDRTMVEFYEKANYKAKLVTTVIFDKTGKLIRTIDPDYELGYTKPNSAEDDELEKYYDKMNMSLANDDKQRVPENVEAAFKLKYPRITNVEWKEDGNMNYQAIYYSARGKEIAVFNRYGELVETWLLGKPGTLSATIQEYMKKEYKTCKVVEFYSVKKVAEKQSFYCVTIQDKKSAEEDILWFTLAGKPVEM